MMSSLKACVEIARLSHSTRLAELEEGFGGVPSELGPTARVAPPRYTRPGQGDEPNSGRGIRLIEPSYGSAASGAAKAPTEEKAQEPRNVGSLAA